jgi:Leucine-rich repeat (LRR) protein
MRKKLLLLALLFTGMVNAQILTFTDTILKNMLVNGGTNNVTAYSGGVQITRIDTNLDGQIQVSEAALIDKLWIEGLNVSEVTDIQGIEGFTNVTELGFNGISTTSINLSGMPNLKSLFVKSPTLVTATVSGMNAMTIATFQQNPLMTTLNISNNPNQTILTVQQNPSFNALNASNLVSLKELYLADNILTSLDLTGCPNLESFNATNNQLTSMNISGLTKLTDFSIEGNLNLTSVNAAGCTLLNFPQSTFSPLNTLTTANFSNCSSLEYLFMPDNVLTTLNLSGCSALINVNVSNNALTTLPLTGCTALTSLNCNNNQLTALNLSTSPNLIEVRAETNAIANLNLTGTTNLKNAFLRSNQIPSLNLSGNTNLQILDLDDNPTTLLNLSGCTALSTLHTTNTTIANADFSNCTALTAISNTSSLLNSVNVQGCTALTNLSLSGTDVQPSPITTLNLSGLTSLSLLNCSYSSLTAIDLTGCTGLINLFCNFLPITTLDFSDSANISVINLSNTKLQTIDVSNLSNLQALSANDVPTLETLFAKNGKNESLFFTAANTSLKFVCQDEANITATKNYLASLGLSNAEVNSYCSFTPGGNYNTITGTVTFDLDNNGCNASDAKQSNLKVGLHDGSAQNETFTKANGKYVFYTGTGNFALTPHLENPALFTILPVTPSLSFTDTNNNVVTQDFCIAAAGSQSDIEIVIAPIIPARPGFMALYQITIKNKGNQTASGSFNFTYNQNIMQYTLATLAPDVQSPGLLSWNYSDLLPFESRSNYFGLTVNTPTQTPPVNLDDVLNFTATINPIAGDFNPADNVFNYNQIVIGSYDPNDIECLEGKSVSPSTIGDYLHYVINFENTGTAPAETVVVKVVVDQTKYDINSLQLLNASHSSEINVHGNVVEFVFDKINLGTAKKAKLTAKDPPVNGHGNILFKIRTIDNLITGDQVGKEADIYFDYNAPIETNKAETIFKSLGTKDHQVDKSVALYPNPTKGNVNINCDNTIKRVELFDVQGRILQTKIESNNSTQLDISNKANGLYFIRITTENGVKVEKLIKE